MGKCCRRKRRATAVLRTKGACISYIVFFCGKPMSTNGAARTGASRGEDVRVTRSADVKHGVQERKWREKVDLSRAEVKRVAGNKEERERRRKRKGNGDATRTGKGNRKLKMGNDEEREQGKEEKKERSWQGAPGLARPSESKTRDPGRWTSTRHHGRTWVHVDKVW